MSLCRSCCKAWVAGDADTLPPLWFAQKTHGSCTKRVELGALSVPIAPRLGRSGPDLCNFEPHLVETASALADLGQHFADIAGNLVESGPDLAKSGPKIHKLVDSGPISAKLVLPKSHKLGRACAKLCQLQAHPVSIGFRASLEKSQVDQSLAIWTEIDPFKQRSASESAGLISKRF